MQKRKFKEYALGLFGLFLGLFLIVLIESALRLVGFGDHLEFVIRGEEPETREYLSLNHQYVAFHYFDHLPVEITSLFKKKPWFENTRFSYEKAPGTYRIFLLGASTTRGFPFTGRRISYSGFLDEILEDVLPDNDVEVINAGYDALSSFGVLDITTRVMDHDPDLLIVYSGHNEFIGHFGVNSAVRHGLGNVIPELNLSLQNTKIFLATKLLFHKFKTWFRGNSKSNQAEFNMFEVMLSKTDFTWNEEQHELALSNLHENLSSIARSAKEKNIPVIFSTLASNLKSFPPVRSEVPDSLPPEDRQEIQRVLSRGVDGLKDGSLDSAIRDLTKLVQKAPQFAMGHFLLGQAYEKKGDGDEALRAYLLAREYDKVHLRACMAENELIRNLGESMQVPVIDISEKLEEASENRLIGEDLFLEHVHPNADGHLLIAETMARFLSKNDFILPEAKWRWEEKHSPRYYKNKVGFTRQTYLESRYLVGRLLLQFPFYQCDGGRDYLRLVGREEAEESLVQRCQEFVSQQPF